MTTHAPAAAPADLAPQAGRRRWRPSPATVGLLGGLVAVLSWGAYLALARAGVIGGLVPVDFVVLRFGAAAVVILPFVLGVRRRQALLDLGLVRAGALALLAGPLFILLGAAGYRLAPLAHGAVVQPVTITVAGMALAALLLGERLSRARVLGAGLAVAGALLVGMAAVAPGQGAGLLLGDVLFMAAGLLWVGFTLLLRRWRLDPVVATAAVSLVSAVLALPLYAALVGFDRLAVLPAPMLLAQVLVQGVLSGAVAVVAFGYAVQRLGAARASLFPSFVPVTATLIGWPIVGEVPTPIQALGLALATAGLIWAVADRSTARPQA